jgi:hypothetical protein
VLTPSIGADGRGLCHGLDGLKKRFYLSGDRTCNSNKMGGQNSPKNMVDDGNLTAFIIRYRYEP